MSPYTAQLTLPRLGESKRCASFYDLQARSFRAEKLTLAKRPVLRKSPYAGLLLNGQGRVLDLDAPALTLPATMGGNRTPVIDQQSLDTGQPNWILQYHRHLMQGGDPMVAAPAYLRRLTLEESAALQTFPRNATWHGGSSAVFRQIGNAVPPNLAYHVALAVKASLAVN